MANCAKCKKGFGCSCSLIGGLCPSCYSETYGSPLSPSTSPIITSRKTARVVYSNKVNAEPNNEFNQILRDVGISKEQKLKRINDILEKAREKYLQ